MVIITITMMSNSSMHTTTMNTTMSSRCLNKMRDIKNFTNLAASIGRLHHIIGKKQALVGILNTTTTMDKSKITITRAEPAAMVSIIQTGSNKRSINSQQNQTATQKVIHTISLINRMQVARVLITTILGRTEIIPRDNNSLIRQHLTEEEETTTVVVLIPIMEQVVHIGGLPITITGATVTITITEKVCKPFCY